MNQIQPNLIDQGLSLLLYGMGTVFVFLTILVFATTLMSRLVNRYAPDEPTQASEPTAPSSLPSKNVVAAIQEAIAQHKNR